MNKNEKFVITINREVGSGGRTVGSLLARRLHVPYYDKALIQALMEKYKLPIEEIEQMKASSLSWWDEFKRRLNLVKNAKMYINRVGDEPEMLTTEDIFMAEKDILNTMATEESCVIAGRSGFFVLKNQPNHLNILIQASMPYRVERLMRKRNISEKEALKVIKKVDKMREKYVKNFGHTSRYDARNYDLVITMDGKKEKEVVDLIMKYIG